MHLDNLSRGYGRYRGLRDVATEDDSSRYESRIRELLSKMHMPAIGDSVTVVIPYGGSIKGQFIRIGEEGISLKTPGSLKPVNVWLYPSYSVETQDGNKIATTDLRELFTKEKIPRTTCASLQTKSDSKHYPIERIKQIWVNRPKRAWIYGAIIGLAVNIIVLDNLWQDIKHFSIP